MERKKPTYKDPETGIESEILSFNEYKERIGFPNLPSPTLNYQIDKGNIDIIRMGTYRYIIFNQKAQQYKPGENYGKRWKK